MYSLEFHSHTDRADTNTQSFDKVTLLYEGYQIYFGSSPQAASYFIEMGFWKHPRATTADFLTSITNPRERTVREGFEDRVPRSPVEFAAVWKRSTLAQALLQTAETSKRDHQMNSTVLASLR
jgi:ATP-binding cassette subfamily G (WHITE) protein 2 (PDR)